jgi:flagellar export protein FliJ
VSFQFSLEVVLRFRRSVEEREEARLISASQRVQAAHQALEIVELEMRHRLENLRHRLQSGVSGAELRFEQLCENALLQRKSTLQQELQALQLAREEQRQRFEAAHRQRLLLEDLREKAHQLYRREEERRAQRRVDDLFLLHREFRARD